LQRAEGDFAAPVRSNDYRRWPAEIEILAIPDVGLDGRPIGEYSAA